MFDASGSKTSKTVNNDVWIVEKFAFAIQSNSLVLREIIDLIPFHVLFYTVTFK